jgi:mannan endo-1,4-beta-mannosidase
MKQIFPDSRIVRQLPRRTILPWLCSAAISLVTSVDAFASNGANLQPSYYNNGNVNFGWSLMKADTKIKTLRLEIEPFISITTVKSWISQARSNGFTLICTYHKASVLGSNSASELTAAANWWKANYRNLSASGSFTINLMNEWGDHNITSNAYASAYNSAISIVRQVYSGNIIIDIPGWGQETHTATQAVKGTNGTKINDTNITLSTHIYPGDWNQGLNHWLQNSDLDEMGGAGRACLVGEFGTGSGSANWSGLVDHAKAKGWSVLAWSWNGDGGNLNMVQPKWASNPTATSFSHSSYFNTVYPKL